MWITFVIFASFVVAMIAMAYFGIQSHDEALQGEGADLPVDGPAASGAHCGLCKAPLRRIATSDEVVFELEHRIDAELVEISRAWHASHDGHGRTSPA